ncbi:hypothetical protein HCU64_00110 [Methylobacterium sp. C25]|uniref:hypothetical protein n=1 Tax=Methylobacterium sp. C25 TaxID=2721622 RepID=UPI001F1EC06C|nr:hypothetical protein [Methylobacterium sp. C25]MCE4222142.1 hypothetical protein [Methylobacterium sp. C25]
MSRREFCWIETQRKDGSWDKPEVGEVCRNTPDSFIVFLTGNECETYGPTVRLIAPVIPPCIEADVAAVVVEGHRDLGVALAKAMLSFFQASFDGGTPLIMLRGSRLISPAVQADVERWFTTWEAKHQEGIRAMHRAMDLLREAKDEAA